MFNPDAGWGLCWMFLGVNAQMLNDVLVSIPTSGTVKGRKSCSLTRVHLVKLSLVFDKDEDPKQLIKDQTAELELIRNKVSDLHQSGNSSRTT